MIANDTSMVGFRIWNRRVAIRPSYANPFRKQDRRMLFSSPNRVDMPLLLTLTLVNLFISKDYLKSLLELM